MTKFYIYGLISLILIFFGLIGFNLYSQFNLSPSNSPQGEYSFKVRQGDNLSIISKKLEADKVIASSWALTTLENWQPIAVLQEGDYSLSVPANPEQILQQIDTQSQKIARDKAEANKRKTIKITFKEGWSADQYFQELDKNGVINKEQIEKYAQNPKNFNLSRWQFLPKPLECQYGDTKKCQKYYVEGYLYPNTYDFFTPSTTQEVFDKLLKGFEDRVWSQLKSTPLPPNYDFNKIVTIASVIEKETGRPLSGVNSTNVDELNQEKKLIAEVFYNRLNRNIKLESDPTVSYGTGRRLCQRTLKIPDCLFLDSPSVQTLYNTYNLAGLPVGPITSPQLSTIQSTLAGFLEENKSDYLFFVSDASGKKYFARTNTEHQANISMVQKINKDLGQFNN